MYTLGLKLCQNLPECLCARVLASFAAMKLLPLIYFIIRHGHHSFANFFF